MMGEFMPEEVKPENILLICTYCEKHRSDSGYWELVFDSHGSIPETCVSHGICPECLKEHFPGEYASLLAEGRLLIKKKILPGNRVIYGCFTTPEINEKLFENYDKKHRH